MPKLKDLKGQKFNLLTVFEFAGVKNSNAQWKCLCECGNNIIVAGYDLRRGQTQSCGCKTKELQAARKRKDITNQIFGRLTVVGFLRVEGTGRSSIYECRCECGTIKEVARQSLVRGHTTSCGCYNRDKQLAGDGVAALNNYMNSYKQSAIKRGLEFSITLEQFKYITSQNCVTCNALPRERKRNYRNGKSSSPIKANGIDRIDSSMGYNISNVQPMCTMCNYSKRSLSNEEYLKWLDNTHKALKMS